MGFSLLIPAIGLGIGALGAEAWLRRNQPKAAGFAAAQRSSPHHRALHNLPAAEYSPAAASIELALLLFTILGLLDWMVVALAAGDWASVTALTVALVAWLALGGIWIRALSQMLSFRSSQEAPAETR